MRAVDLKVLWGRAAGRCSNPECSVDLLPDMPLSGTVVLAEMAHIIARSPDGPRGRVGCPGDETYENLILLCPLHHTEADSAPRDHPADKLRAWKLRHEAAVRSALARRAPPTVWDVPYPANRRIAGREEALQSLAHRLTTSPVQVLHGLAGVGKTQLAVHFAQRFADDYTVVGWLDAAGRPRLLADVRRLAALLRLPGSDIADEAALLGAVRRWLARERDWLLVLDRAADPRLVEEVVPDPVRGHVVVTSLSPAWRRVGVARKVGPLGPGAGAAYLLGRTGSTDRSTARRLAGALGGLPLALEQCAAYVEATRRELSDYLSLFERQPAEVLSAGPVPADYDATVARTFAVAIASVDARHRPAALSILRLLSLLDASPIHRAALVELVRGMGDPDAPTGQPATDLALAALSARSLVELQPDTVAIHSVVQAVIRAQSDAAALREQIGAVAGALSDAIDPAAQRVDTFAGYARLLPHALATAAHAERCGVVTPATVNILDRMATHLQAVGQYRDARELFERAVRAADGETGIRESQRFSLHLNYGLLLRELDPEAARAQLESTLERFGNEPRGDREHDLRVADTHHNLALTLWDLDEIAAARAHLELAREIDRRAHPEEQWPERAGMINAAMNAALLSRSEGDRRGAISANEDALGLLGRARSPDPAQHARALSNAGVFYEECDEPAKALVLQEAALRLRRRALGETHPDTIVSVVNLGGAFRRLAAATRDRALMEAALENHERAERLARKVFGPAHVEVASALNNKGLDLTELDRPEEAIAAHEEALAVRRKALPPRHSAILQSLNNLGRALAAAGRYDDAAGRFRAALDLWRGSDLAAHHAQVAIALDGLGRTCLAQGDRPAAYGHFRAAYEAYRDGLGPDAESTIRARRKMEEASAGSGAS